MKKITLSVAAVALAASGALVAVTPQASASVPAAASAAKAPTWKRCDGVPLYVTINKKRYNAGTVNVQRRGSTNLLRVTLKHNPKIVIRKVNVPIGGKPLVSTATWRPVQRKNIRQPAKNNLSGAFVISQKNTKTGRTLLDHGYLNVARYVVRETPIRDDGANTAAMLLSSASHFKTTISINQAWSVNGEKDAGKGKRATATAQFGSTCLDVNAKGGGVGSW